MTRSIIRVGVSLSAALAVLTTIPSAQGQGQEQIVGAQVISDTVAEPGSYVGDVPSDAGGCAGGNCAGGACAGGNCAGGNCAGGNCGGGHCRNCGPGAGLFQGGGVFGRHVPGGSEGCFPRTYGQPDLFYNFYTQGNCNRVNAQMYVSPLPVPPHVGQTYLTYQPFYPHEYMYRHKNRFHTYYDSGRGMNRTRAVYYSPPVRQAASNFYWNILRIPR